MQKNYRIDFLSSLSDNLTTWQEVSGHVSMIMINAKRLDQHGSPVHTRYLDLAMIFTVQNEFSDYMEVYVLQENDLDRFGVTKDQVYKTAESNALLKRRFRLMPLSEALDQSMLAPLAKDTPVVDTKNSNKVVLDVDPITGEENVLVCTLKHRPFGAAYMFMPKVLDEVSKRFNRQDFYIIPVSMHEVWFIKNSYVSRNGKKSYQDVEIDLLDMLEEYNDTVNTNWQDILSYQLYYYLGNDNHAVMPVKN